MKKVVALLLSLAVSGVAGAQEPVPANQQNTGAAKDFNNMVKSLSNLLSATNPKPIESNNLEPAAGANPQGQDYSNMVRSLPPLIKKEEPVPVKTEVIAPQPMVLPQPLIQPVVQPVVQPVINPEPKAATLPADTRRLLRLSGSGIGNQPRLPKGSVTLERGGFDPEFGNLSEPIDLNEPASEPVAEAEYEVEVQAARRSDSIESILEKAMYATKAGQYEAAVVYYKDALKRDGNSRDALFGIATAYQKAGQKKEAKLAYGKLLRLHPKFEPGLNNLLIIAGEEAPQDALKELDVIAKKNPNFAAVHAQKGAIYNKLGDDKNAKASYAKALSLDSDNVTYKYNLAVILDGMGEVKSAAKLYNELIEQSFKGANLPVSRTDLQERVSFITSKRDS